MDKKRIKTSVNNIDKYVGFRLKKRRKQLGISQSFLGENAGGLTFQQIQKYESGTNRISCSKLYQFSLILGVDTSYFFEEINKALLEDDLISHLLIIPKKKERLNKDIDLVSKYLVRIKNPILRKQVIDFVKMISKIET